MSHQRSLGLAGATTIMALWPFRRKSHRKCSHAEKSDAGGARERSTGPLRHEPYQTVPNETVKATVRKTQRTEPRKQQRRQRAYSFSPGRDESISIGCRRGARTRPKSRASASAHPGVRLDQRHDKDGDNVDSGVSVQGNERVVFEYPPTLRHKRNAEHISRKNPNKKRCKADRAREAEIRDWGKSKISRPAIEEWSAGRPMKDMWRNRTWIVMGFRGVSRHEWDRENPSSDVSLPPPESIRSCLSSDSDHVTYKVSALDVLAPRPTLLYASHPRWTVDGPFFGQRFTQHPRLSTPIPEATLRAHKRIHELADDLSASDLRELMERDNRRRQRRRERDQEKLERRLARKAEKLKSASDDVCLDRETVGLGIKPASVAMTSSRIQSSSSSQMPTGSEENKQQPLEVFQTTSITPCIAPVVERPEELEPEQTCTPPSSKSNKSSRNVLRKKTRSKSPPTSSVKPEASDMSHRTSEGGSSKGRSWMSSLFRWGRKEHQGNSEGPSSYSNTWRDSIPSAQHLLTPTPPPNFVPRRVRLGLPHQTRSRFREDLPELPASPPESRTQSPLMEAIPPPAEKTATSEIGCYVVGTTTVPTSPQPRYQTPESGDRSIDSAMRQSSASMTYNDEPGVSPEPVAMSLASIDSEGSWFGGRSNKKRHSSLILESGGVAFKRESGSSEKSRTQDQPTVGDVSMADCNAVAEQIHMSVGSSDDGILGAVRVQQPIVSVNRIQSQKGLLNSFDEEGDSGIAAIMDHVGNTDDEMDDISAEHKGVQHAMSAELGKGHERRISDGSTQVTSNSRRSLVDERDTSV